MVLDSVIKCCVVQKGVAANKVTGCHGGLLISQLVELSIEYALNAKEAYCWQYMFWYVLENNFTPIHLSFANTFNQYDNVDAPVSALMCHLLWVGSRSLVHFIPRWWRLPSMFLSCNFTSALFYSHSYPHTSACLPASLDFIPCLC